MIRIKLTDPNPQIHPNTTNSDRSKGFTLVELLIVIGITLVLASATIPIYGNLQVSGQLNDTEDRIIQTLRTAQGRSEARLNNSSHGVYFEINTSRADRYILYQGDSYATRDTSYDRAETPSASITFSTTLSGSDVSFSKGLGAPNATGTITLTHDIQGTRSVVINSLGTVEAQ
jgi:prepilin-type N-terminal cleavage/methylation domain-containing protein